MKPQLIILLAAVTVAVAMVPKLRRAVNLEEELRHTMENSNKDAASTATQICKPDMPCAWYIYINSQKIIETNFINPYCKCTAGTECQFDEDDENISAYIHRCRPPSHDDKTKS